MRKAGRATGTGSLFALYTVVWQAFSLKQGARLLPMRLPASLWRDRHERGLPEAEGAILAACCLREAEPRQAERFAIPRTSDPPPRRYACFPSAVHSE